MVLKGDGAEGERKEESSAWVASSSYICNKPMRTLGTHTHALEIDLTLLLLQLLQLFSSILNLLHVNSLVL